MLCWFFMAKLIPEMESIRETGSNTVSLTILVYIMIIATTIGLPEEKGDIKKI